MPPSSSQVPPQAASQPQPQAPAQPQSAAPAQSQPPLQQQQQQQQQQAQPQPQPQQPPQSQSQSPKIHVEPAYKNLVEERLRVLRNRIILEQTMLDNLDNWEPLEPGMVATSVFEDPSMHTWSPDYEEAVLMIQHLRSWFEPDIQSVAKFRTTAKIVLHEVFFEYGTLISKVVDAGYDFQSMKFNKRSFATLIPDLQKYQKMFAVTVDDPAYASRQKQLELAVTTLTERVDAVDMKVKALLNNIGETTQLYTMCLAFLGSSFWLFVTYFKKDSEQIIDSMRAVVSAMMNLGEVPTSDVEFINKTLEFTSVVSVIALSTRLGESGTMLSESCFGLCVLVRSLISAHVQGMEKDPEVNQRLAKYLQDIKDTVTASQFSASGPDVTAQQEEEIANSGLTLLAESLDFYQANIPSPASYVTIVEKIAAVAKQMGEVFLLLKQFPPVAITMDKVGHKNIPPMTAYPWALLPLLVEMHQSVATLCDAMKKESTILVPSAKVLQLQFTEFTLAVSCYMWRNNICPRHHLSICLKYLAFTLVFAMDLLYLTYEEI
eukprot:TRINITY_DN821_c0_g1_i4.p1 TRINITY_DN821_c0_g1~~TRINITY_DN821_c0_g1_i4.p1  ORF type:complete len:547 (-),score=193.65 TRINITY_DN821_c0_g1_i4:16-1656(-)